MVLWTRLSDLSSDLPVSWHVARDEAFTQLVATGTATARADADYTVKVDALGLSPASSYFYRFTAAGVSSPIGRTRTAPDPDHVKSAAKELAAASKPVGAGIPSIVAPKEASAKAAPVDDLKKTAVLGSLSAAAAPGLSEIAPVKLPFM